MNTLIVGLEQQTKEKPLPQPLALSDEWRKWRGRLAGSHVLQDHLAEHEREIGEDALFFAKDEAIAHRADRV
ncbi:MAG: hypothetical protein DWI57_09365 [Chloroflexi bacterium]|nr:MAG: hypothetical protein DWI57_09365 [Chloroflexota bacterium]